MIAQVYARDVTRMCCRVTARESHWLRRPRPSLPETIIDRLPHFIYADGMGGKESGKRLCVSNYTFFYHNISRKLAIQRDLEAALSEKPGFSGAISFQKSCGNAPNPGLLLSRCDPLGLPLNFREAEIFKMHAAQAAFAEGTQITTDFGGCDSWQMDATLVSVAPYRIMSILSEDSFPRSRLKIRPGQTGSHARRRRSMQLSE